MLIKIYNDSMSIQYSEKVLKRKNSCGSVKHFRSEEIRIKSYMGVMSSPKFFVAARDLIVVIARRAP